MNKQKHFAIVDIETTGSHAAGARITEIAILIHNGKKVIEEYQSLVNPDCPIPYAIQTLTGIDNEMVADAPYFSDIAEDVYHLLQGKVFVAHNVNFDYSFIHRELKQAEYEWEAPKLCTVRLSRKLLPGFSSYSLGNLCRQVGIPLSDRHRAMGDVRATSILFDKLLDADSETGLITKSLQEKRQHKLPTQLSQAQVDKLPETAGVYTFKDSKGKIIYVGKAVNLKKRVLSHFSGNSSSLRRQEFINDIAHIDFLESGTELMALLMECQLIKKHWPIHNQAQKKYEPKFTLFHYEDMRGYSRLAISKVSALIKGVQYFENATNANQFLNKLISTYQISTACCSFYTPGTTEKVMRSESTTMELPDREQHNATIDTILTTLREQQRSFILIDQGRHETENSYIYFKEEKLFAFGFVEELNQWAEAEDVVSYRDKCITNNYMQELVLKYAEENPSKVRYLSAIKSV